MADDAVGSHSDSMSDRAMLDATGRHPDEWFAFLDAQDATTWTHSRIADWLREQAPEVSGRWRQAIAVRYEQARGMLAPGQGAR
ncbi:MAG: hypothetical protein JWP85_195 [Rhodoglobus sp.]|nr:hypothetical protein [Rhodoglobus sp.]